jgi:hypothetical protein
MSDQDQERRNHYTTLLREADDVTMDTLKHIIGQSNVSDLENFLAHALNTILENNRSLGFSLSRNMSMIAGTSLRNLLENWANVAYILRDPLKKQHYGGEVTKTAFEYANTLNRLVKDEITFADLQALPRWTSSAITQRVAALGDGQEFQYELLSRYTHTDMWAAINDEMVAKHQFWTSLLGWGLEFTAETLTLVKSECSLPEDLRQRITDVSGKISVAISVPQV